MRRRGSATVRSAARALRSPRGSRAGRGPRTQHRGARGSYRDLLIKWDEEEDVAKSLACALVSGQGRRRPEKRGRGAPGQSGRTQSRGRGGPPSNRRKFPKVQITVACEERDL